jgi:diacylglycerol kinase (ATP)
MTTWITIVNGAAGGGRCAEAATAALERLRQGGLTLDVRFTERAGHATEIARAAQTEGSRHFIAVGGDGTSFEVVNGLFPRDGDGPVTLGFLPLGTGNSFIRDFGLIDTDSAIEALVKGDKRPCDVVKLTHDGGELHYINLMSVGFSARVGALTNRRFKPFGAAGYALAVGASVVGLAQPSYAMTVDDGPRDARPCTLLSFSNSRFTGGTMMMAPDADPGDGYVDVIRIGELSRLGLLRAFPKIYQGTHVTLDSVETSRAKRVAFDGVGTLDCMIDGEIMSLGLQSLEVLPSTLEVVA